MPKDDYPTRGSGTLHRCSFCGKTQDQVRRLVAGPNVFICNECIMLCQEIIADDMGMGHMDEGEMKELPTPAAMKAVLDENEIINKSVKTSDGHYYAVPFLRGTTTEGNSGLFTSGFFMRKDILDELKLEVPETIDEWDTVLHAVKAAHPDMIPFATRTEWLNNIFASGWFTALNDGKTSAVLSFCRTILFMVIPVLVLPRFFEMDGVWMSLAAGEILSSVMSVYYFIKYRAVWRAPKTAAAD